MTEIELMGHGVLSLAPLPQSLASAARHRIIPKIGLRRRGRFSHL